MRARAHNSWDSEMLLLSIFEQAENVVAHNDPSLASEDVFSTHRGGNCCLDQLLEYVNCQWWNTSRRIDGGHGCWRPIEAGQLIRQGQDR